MVTEAQVWDALAEIPDPEIPVISLVDLGVVREIEVKDGHVVSTSRRRSSAARRSRSCAMRWPTRFARSAPSRRSTSVLDDSWSTDRITPAGREKLRASGFAPPAPREADRADARAAPERCTPLPVLRLDGDAAREHLRPDPLQVAALLRDLQAAVRAVQDDLVRGCYLATSCRGVPYRVGQWRPSSREQRAFAGT